MASSNVGSDATIAPPINAPNLRCRSALTFDFIVDGISDCISDCNLVSIPGNIELPPDSKDAVFFMTDPLLYHKFENIVIFRSGYLYSFCSPGNQDYQKIMFFLIKKVEIDKKVR